ncbi:MAG: hypothetical protein IJU40_05200 [Desulfovibrionaceae bacterium]|nr:hypothetical protein [Desulfovibrionaceae bacterium]
MEQAKSISNDLQKTLNKPQNKRSRPVVILEANSQSEYKEDSFTKAEKLRKVGNNLICMLQKKLDQLYSAKKYRKLCKLYKKSRQKEDLHTCQIIGEEMQDMHNQYNVTFNYCCQKARELNSIYKLETVPLLNHAKDIWRGVEKCLYGQGKKLNYLKFGNLPGNLGK